MVAVEPGCEVLQSIPSWAWLVLLHEPVVPSAARHM